MRKRLLFTACAGVALLAAILLTHSAPPDQGRARYFTEIAQAINGVRAGDAQAWLAGWQEAGDRAVAQATKFNDPISKGNFLLRAHSYYRAAEFFLPPNDPRRPALWSSNVSAFYAGLDALGVAHQRLTIPYGQHHLNAIYYPGSPQAQSRPLLVVVGGYDSTMEELYFSIAAAAIVHGYSVLTYEGPGQGSVLREQSLVMQSDWEKPNGAVLDTFLSTHPAPHGIILFGESLGGYLAPRAAAFDSRIDAVVAYDVFFDGYAIASRNVPPIAFWLRDHGYNKTLRFLSGLNTNPGANWAVQNGEWVLGVTDPFAVLDAFKAYRLAPVASRIKADLLILAGADDHFVPANQSEEFRKSLTSARSITSLTFSHESGGGEHCQLGASSLWQAALFDWLAQKFPLAKS